MGIGDLYGIAGETGIWMLVALLQSDVVVLRYETVASEPNWGGTEGYVLCDVGEDGTLVDSCQINAYIKKT